MQTLSTNQKQFCCLIKSNVPILTNDYEWHIDTGDAKPVTVKNVKFGMHEIPIIQTVIDSLLKNNQIAPDKYPE